MQKLNLFKNVLVLSCLGLFVMSCESHEKEVRKETKTEVIKPLDNQMEKTTEKEN